MAGSGGGAGGWDRGGATSLHPAQASTSNTTINMNNRLSHGRDKFDTAFSFVVPPSAIAAAAAAGTAATRSGKATTAGQFPWLQQQQPQMQPQVQRSGSVLIMQRDPQQQQQQLALLHTAAKVGAGVVDPTIKIGREPGELSRTLSAPRQEQQGSSFAPSPGGKDSHASALDANGKMSIDTVRRFVARVTGPFPVLATNVAEIKHFFTGWVEPGMLILVMCALSNEGGEEGRSGFCSRKNCCGLFLSVCVFLALYEISTH